MGGGDLLHVQPSELKFPFEVRRLSSCVMQLTSNTDQYVAFKVKTTNPRKYCVRPNVGVVVPGTTCSVTVTLQPQREAPPDLKCSDKFLVQCVVSNAGAMAKDINSDMFNKEPGKVVEEFKLKVIYFPANPPSPVPEDSEESLSPRSSMTENGNRTSALLDDASRYLDRTNQGQNPETLIAKLTNEKDSAMQLNQKLHQELDLLRKESQKRRGGGFSLFIVFLVGLLSVLLGYMIKKKLTMINSFAVQYNGCLLYNFEI